MNSFTPQDKRISSFDGLRALAIILVYFGHAKHTIESKNQLWNILSIFIANSGLGVRLFFVLSGYLITMLMIKEINKTGHLKLKRFYVRRILRIFPSFYSFLAVVFILNLVVDWNITVQQFAAAASFTWNYKGIWHDGSIAGNWFLGHFWTLSLEEQFYLLWPFLIVFFGIKKVRLISLSTILLLPFLRVLIYFLFPSQRGYLGMMLHTAIDSIMVGCYMAIVTQNPAYCQYIHKFKESLIVILLIWPLIISPILDFYIRGYSISIGLTIDALILGFMIAWLHNNPLSYINQFLSNIVLVYIGKLSYSLYLWQQLFLTPLNTTVSGIFPYNIGFSFLVALISYYLIEKPFLRLKDSPRLSALLNISK
jgi:peptidoglycan/LPS O-acetylase OafA/YrhL